MRITRVPSSLSFGLEKNIIRMAKSLPHGAVFQFTSSHKFARKTLVVSVIIYLATAIVQVYLCGLLPRDITLVLESIT